VLLVLAGLWVWVLQKRMQAAKHRVKESTFSQKTVL
jgi:hypothetical protein